MTSDDENDLSVSLLIEFAGFKAYFGGDTHAPVEAAMAALEERLNGGGVDLFLDRVELRPLELLRHARKFARGANQRIGAHAMAFRELRLRKDPSCPSCGPDPSIRELAAP